MLLMYNINKIRIEKVREGHNKSRGAIMHTTFFEKHKDTGLLILRVGLGAMFLTHGAPKMFAGPEMWAKLGMAMGNIGIHFLPVFWGFMASFSEFAGGLFLMLGLFTRPACALLAFTMSIASIFHFSRGDGLKGASHAIENGIVFLSLILIGPGKYSLDGWIAKRKK